MLKIRLTSNQSSYLKGMRAHHSIPSRSRRDTPSCENRNLALERRGWVDSGGSTADQRMTAFGALPPVGLPALRLVSGRADQRLSDDGGQWKWGMDDGKP